MYECCRTVAGLHELPSTKESGGRYARTCTTVYVIIFLAILVNGSHTGTDSRQVVALEQAEALRLQLYRKVI